MLGAIVGDVVGSVYEWHNVKHKDFDIYRKDAFPTDDSFMTVAVSRALMGNIERYRADGYGAGEDFYHACSGQMRSYGRANPMAGYGKRFMKWLLDKNSSPYNSLGNGSAMRVSAVGWAFDSLEQTEKYAMLSALMTHNHPEGIKGAQAVAGAIYLGRSGAGKDDIREYVKKQYGYDLSRSVDEIRPNYRFDETCPGSVPEAITCFLEGESFEDVLRNAVSIGGDSDTVAAIACSMAEAVYPIGKELLAHVLDRIDPYISWEELSFYEECVLPYMIEKGWRKARK